MRAWVGRSRTWAALVGAAVVASLALPPADGRAADRPPSALRPEPGVGVHELTLVTGDRVRVAPAGGGRRAVTVIPAPGPGPATG